VFVNDLIYQNQSFCRFVWHLVIMVGQLFASVFNLLSCLFIFLLEPFSVTCNYPETAELPLGPFVKVKRN